VSTVSENLDVNVGTNSAWERIWKNIKTSAKQIDAR
jgi:hypothetical protein